MDETKQDAPSAERQRFVIGDPFARLKFPRETGARSYVHESYFYVTDTPGDALDPISTLSRAFRCEVRPGDEITISTGEMDLRYRSLPFKDQVETAGAVAASICFLMRSLQQRYPTFSWVFSSLRPDDEFDQFYSKERLAYPHAVRTPSVSTPKALDALRRMVNTLVEHELSDTPITISS